MSFKGWRVAKTFSNPSLPLPPIFKDRVSNRGTLFLGYLNECYLKIGSSLFHGNTADEQYLEELDKKKKIHSLFSFYRMKQT